jgi:type I restriction enzyme M protein
MARPSEMETVIKKIIPYLQRRGYDLDNDLSLNYPTDVENRKGFIDILVHCGRSTPSFVIEAKRDGTRIAQRHRKQAIEYGRSLRCLFVAITNGNVFELLNTQTKKPLKLNGSSSNRIPSKSDLTSFVLPQLRTDPRKTSISISADRKLPFRPSLTLSKLNHLFKQCHNSIRKIEKNEEYAFSDFSKMLFLKLLEEKWDKEGTAPPYSYTFHELATTRNEQADRVQTAIQSMIETIRNDPRYGDDVLADPIKLKKEATYLIIVKRLSKVSFIDCQLDIKGATFEYFVRATLKGKKLGQYFTPRPLVKLMLALGKYRQIVSNLMASQPFKVLDPACGTGGFLVYAMNMCIQDVEDKLARGEITPQLATSLRKKLKEDTFYGIDAHEGIASSAKMNMVIAGDGHNNIRCADSLKQAKMIPPYETVERQKVNDGKAHLILTNPPFGTSEGESLTPNERSIYDVQSTKGQSLFIQKMIRLIHEGNMIVTVIDDGVLNTASDAELRTLLLKECRAKLIIGLPDETFKPNKINVKSSVLVLEKRGERDEDLQDDYPVGCITLKSLGYEGSGDEIRGFKIDQLIEEVSSVNPYNFPKGNIQNGYNWSGFRVQSSQIIADRTKRLDIKYWDASTISTIETLRTKSGTKTIEDINLIETKRGKSPPESEYVSASEGYALVVKAGSNISPTGELKTAGGDYIEEGYFREKYNDEEILKDGDILLSSSGEGTLGKCCVYRNKDEQGKTKPAIAETHVTVIRVDRNEICPEFLCDYLRKGFGQRQISRLYTGTTGIIELQPHEVKRIVVPPIPTVEEQERVSKQFREIEKSTDNMIKESKDKLPEAERAFYETTLEL